MNDVFQLIKFRRSNRKRSSKVNYLAIKISADCFIGPRLVIKVCISLFFGISDHIGHRLKIIAENLINKVQVVMKYYGVKKTLRSLD